MAGDHRRGTLSADAWRDEKGKRGASATRPLALKDPYFVFDDVPAPEEVEPPVEEPLKPEDD